MRALCASQVVFMHVGELETSYECFAKARSLDATDSQLDQTFLYGIHPGITMASCAAWTLWFLGRPNDSAERMREALKLARDLSEPPGHAHALFSAAVLHHLRREPRAAAEQAEAALAVSRAHGLVLYEAMASGLKAWSLLDQGLADEAVDGIRCALSANQAAGTGVLRPYLLTLLAEALNASGRVDEGLRALNEALDVAEQTGELCYLAEIHRTKGELLRARGSAKCRAGEAAPTGVLVDPAAADLERSEECFRTAVEVARRQGALALELRASTSLARALRDRRERDAAREVVAAAYGKFAEGAESADLEEARVLLGELD
jgi:tetratricopeptide (TPR) repeat protein